METKLCVSLCALLLLGFGSADLDLSDASPTAAETRPDYALNQTIEQGATVGQEVSPTVTQKITTASPASTTQQLIGVKDAVSPTTNQTGSDADEVLATAKPPDVATANISSTESHSSASTQTPLRNKPTTPSDHQNSTDVSSTVQPLNSTSPTTRNLSSSPPPTISILNHTQSTTLVHSQPPTKPGKVITSKPEVHPDTQTKLNRKGDTTKEHGSPPIDPLLAGLVSAFIITAVIITLLLFLKLKRRDSRPEFRRLQDLPMDDMMEDTPLSMYSY